MSCPGATCCPPAEGRRFPGLAPGALPCFPCLLARIWPSVGSPPHSLALHHRPTRLPAAAPTPLHPTLSLWGAQCLQQGPRAVLPGGTNNPTELPQPPGRMLVGPPAPPSSCDVPQQQELGNTIPLSKWRQTMPLPATGVHVVPIPWAMLLPLAPIPLCPSWCLQPPALMQTPQDQPLAAAPCKPEPNGAELPDGSPPPLRCRESPCRGSAGN